MTITQVQMDINWNDVRANIETASQWIDSHPGSDLYILPEMWATGYMVDDVHADDGRALGWMKHKAAETNAAVCGSLAVRAQDGSCRNRMYFVTPDEVWYYDKRHLFGYGGEDRQYTAGEQRTVVTWRGVRFLLQICYDLRFPCFARNHIVESDGKETAEYDVVIYLASWPESRRHAWEILLQARAIENQCYVLGVNRVGQDPACAYNGGTMAVDAYGRVMDSVPDNMAGVITSVLDIDRLNSFRQKFPVLYDANKDCRR
ncbi:MAG: nitrilase family protein [Bacteroidaceae bacterium]|nr:nitrilase family protein [Bacteroidaceae bacterium]